MDGRFAALEELMKMLEDKQKLTTSKSKETTGGHGMGGNPNPFRGRENSKVEVLEVDDVMPPLEPLSSPRLIREIPTLHLGDQAARLLLLCNPERKPVTLAGISLSFHHLEPF
ncbi:hypothetical protein M5K25_025828 [Dendrobium thyrsiflorum]|uniref:Uncharacterized protein n=1 Tax=Dendrobium thyrsiflorum TaxID=117978 RepID=A0ABD0TVY0_DENTH